MKVCARAVLWLCVIVSSVAPTRSATGQGFDSDRFADPISSDALIEWFGPVIDDGATWSRLLELHAEYLDRQRITRELELEPWMRRVDVIAAQGGANPATTAALLRGFATLRRTLAELDDAFLRQVAAIVGERVAPMAEWFRVRRALAECECGLDEQTEDVTFSLLSYSELALDMPPLVWAAPQAASVFAAYDARVMRWGKAFKQVRRALAQELEAAEADAANDSDRDLDGWADDEFEAESDEGEFFHAASEGDDAGAEHGATELERLGLRQTRRLALFGRSSLPAFESALSPRARLLMRLRLISRVARFAEPDERGEHGGEDGGEEGGDGASATPTLRADLAKLRRLLDQTIDPRTRIGIDLAAVENFAARHWEEIATISEEMLKVTRRASDVRFAEGREPTEEEQAGDQTRLLELARRWKPLAAAATPVLKELVENGARLSAALAQNTRRHVAVAADAAEDDALRPPTLVAGEGRSRLEGGAWLSTLGTHRPGPVSVDRIVETLGLRRGDDDLLLLVPTLRDEVLAKAWAELAPLVDALELAIKEAAAREESGREQPLREDPTHARLRDELRRAIGTVDATLIGELEQVVADPEHRLRLRLLELSTAIKAAMRRVAAVEGAHRIVAGPVDLADLALAALYDVRSWSTMFVSGEHVENELAPAPSSGEGADPASREDDQALREAIALAILESHDELLAAAQATGEALLELDLATTPRPPSVRHGRLVEIFRFDSENDGRRRRRREVEPRQLAASERVAAAVQQQVAVESRVLDSAIQIAGAESRLGARLRRAGLRTSMWPVVRDLHDDGLGSALAATEAVGRADGRLADAVGTVRAMGRSGFEQIEQRLRSAAEDAGTVFAISDVPRAQSWERVVLRAHFDVTELNGRMLVELGRRVGDVDAPLRQQLGLHGVVGRVIGCGEIVATEDGGASVSTVAAPEREGSAGLPEAPPATR